ncbi:unnamed protein product [Phyllotreta striolata]|uniref:Anosmin-1 n=1 Tax=Phyllotreta striolata TaxID=444603 RepID=A0A9N9TL13_PHYSR|nr:unnamed protein product [Phyllotreta striolata]
MSLSVSAGVRRIAVSLGALVVAASVLQGTFGKLRSWYGRQEPLVVARCEIRCWNEDERNLCVKNCLQQGLEKPGSCPTKDISPFTQVCIQSCEKDSQCSGVLKCCQHSCGVTCQTPVNLDFVIGLPNTPREPRVVEGRRKRTVHIEWSSLDEAYTNPAEAKLLYLIEERHHLGKYFNSNLLTDWSACSKSLKKNRLLKHLVKPGRWYQFRVAAINENGTRGYSESSLPFRITASPKPPKAPQNVTVGPLIKFNGTLHALLKWSPPESDLPIQKYKVFWSRRLHGAKALDSVLVHQQILPKDATEFLLQDLQPKSQYFLQVQGFLQYGKERLKGEKSGLVLNTTDFISENDNTLTMNQWNSNKINGLRLLKLMYNRGSLKARLVWKPSTPLSKYTVTCWSNPCDGKMNAFKHFKFVAVTKSAHFDLVDLQFNYRYKVSVKKLIPNGRKATENTFVTFSTPKCSNFKRNYRKLKC